MNLIRRLRNRETTNNKQAFVYTPTMLTALAAEPDVIIPVCLQPTFNDYLIMSATEGFLQCNGLHRPHDF